MQNQRMLVDAPSVVLKMFVWRAYEYYLEGDDTNAVTLANVVMAHTNESQQLEVKSHANRARQMYSQSEMELMTNTYPIWNARLIDILLAEAMANIREVVIILDKSIFG